MKQLFSILLIVICVPVQAELFQIVNRQYGGQPQAAMDILFDQLESSVNANLPNSDASSYLQGVANATVASSSGMDADYASTFNIAYVGARAGAGADLGNNTLSDVFAGRTQAETLGGASSQAAILIGYTPASSGRRGRKRRSRGFLDFKNAEYYVHYLSQTFDFQDFSGSFSSFGVSAQFNLVSPAYSWLAKWGGVDWTVGVRNSNVNMSITRAVNQTVSDGVTMTFDGTANVGADVNIWSIPLELSTSARVFGFLTLFGGFATDISFGSSSSVATLTGPVTVSDSGVSGDAQLDLGQDASPQAFGLRGFGGVQIELYALSIHAQYTQTFSNDTIGLNVGASVYW